ncbi:EF-hand domain-containing protein [Coraliomargarita parva]|uniref:EF-hand domain-containing protein n=1 Tax=Coraliomargarita parva TaxID=3014050 RepID=UPI0022B520CF|nr:EF-hand domain-containing protein [Coraliomargarita parva]
MKIKQLLLVAIAATLIPALSHAEPGQGPDGPGGPGKKGDFFKKLDTDGDKQLSKEEVADAKRLSENFDKIDADSDGYLTPEELRAHMKQMREERDGGERKKLDTDGDGVITKAEAEEAGAKRLLENFDKIDTDGNGEISREEMMAARKERRGPPPPPPADEE